MGCKVSNASGAVGYWGRSINTRIEQEQIPEKINALLIDKLRSRGKSAYLWTQVTEDTPNSIECSCIKDTTERSDITCCSCYGTKFIPGYIKFLHETLYFASISPGNTLVNTSIKTDIRPHRVELSDDQLSGSITSARLQFSNPLEFDWEVDIIAPNILETNLVTISFSVNGIDFYPIEEINDIDKKPIGIGGIYLRASMSRSITTNRSPSFEIVRIRHSNKEKPYILILRPNVNEIPALMQYGNRIENVGERFWTLPLNYFCSNIPANSSLARIKENSFYERVTGLNAGIRFVTTKLMFNEEFGGEDGYFTQQSFEPRRVQSEEVYSALVF